MSETTSSGSDVDRKVARNKHKRSREERNEHNRNYNFPGPKHRRKNVPMVMPIESETPDETMVMQTYLCMACLTTGWFACSLIGTIVCGGWRNHFSINDFLCLPSLFDTYPVNRWAVNTAVSFYMLLFFASQFWRFFKPKCREIRERQKKFVKSAGHLREDKDLEAGRGFGLQPMTGTGPTGPPPSYPPPAGPPRGGAPQGELSPGAPVPGGLQSAAAGMAAPAGAGAGALGLAIASGTPSTLTDRVTFPVYDPDFSTLGTNPQTPPRPPTPSPQRPRSAFLPPPNPWPTPTISGAYPSSTLNIGGTIPSERRPEQVMRLELGSIPGVEASEIPSPDPHLAAPLTSTLHPQNNACP